MQKHPYFHIGIDIDNVVSESYTAYIDRFNRQFGTAITYEEVHDFYYFEKWSGIAEEKVTVFFDAIEKDEEFIFSFPPIKDALTVIRNWSHKGYFLHYITARNINTRSVSEKWLRHHGFMEKGASLDLFDKKEFPHSADFKKATVEKYHCEVMIEDHTDMANALSIPVILLDMPWNRGIQKDHIIRVKNWKEIEREVEKIRRES
jgi:uncharacterized protein